MRLTILILSPRSKITQILSLFSFQLRNERSFTSGSNDRNWGSGLQAICFDCYEAVPQRLKAFEAAGAGALSLPDQRSLVGSTINLESSGDGGRDK